MRGKDEQQLDVFSYVSPEQRVPQDHPLRPLRVMTDEALRELCLSPIEVALGDLPLFQLRVLRFPVLPDGDVGVSIFPQREEI